MSPPIEEGIYYIRNRGARTLLHISGTKETVTCNSHNLNLLSRFLFQVKKGLNNENLVTISNMKTNTYLDQDNSTAGLPLNSHSVHPERLSQEWRPEQIRGAGVGKFYVLVNAQTGHAVDLERGDKSDNTPVIAHGKHSGLNQQWEFIKLPDPASGKCSPHELQVWIDRAEAAEAKAKETMKDLSEALNLANVAEGKVKAADEKVKDAEEKVKQEQEKVKAEEKKTKDAEEKTQEAEKKAKAAEKKAEEQSWKVAALEQELATEHKSDEAKEKNRQWLRDMVCYFEYRYGATPDLLGTYPYVNGHADYAENWEWVKGKLLNN